MGAGEYTPIFFLKKKLGGNFFDNFFGVFYFFRQGANWPRIRRHNYL